MRGCSVAAVAAVLLLLRRERCCGWWRPRPRRRCAWVQRVLLLMRLHPHRFWRPCAAPRHRAVLRRGRWRRGEGLVVAAAAGRQAVDAIPAAAAVRRRLLLWWQVSTIARLLLRGVMRRPTMLRPGRRRVRRCWVRPPRVVGHARIRQGCATSQPFAVQRDSVARWSQTMMMMTKSFSMSCRVNQLLARSTRGWRSATVHTR